MSRAIDVTIIRNTKNMMTALTLSNEKKWEEMRNEKEHMKRAYYIKYIAGFFEKSLLKYLHFNIFISFVVLKKYTFYNESKDRMLLIL